MAQESRPLEVILREAIVRGRAGANSRQDRARRRAENPHACARGKTAYALRAVPKRFI